MNSKDEYILCSAIWFDDNKKYKNQAVKSGYIVTGRRHSDCFTTAYILSKKDFSILDFEKEQGFLTNTNRFVDRYEGAKIAFKAKQIDKEINKLHSEDLY